ncbi:MAG: NADH:flavin oxidoreductase [Phycisphaera sp.]|nr:NADH:flavin oxidoreductase [Phycisphaera sp.]
MAYKRIGHLKTVDAFRDYMTELGLDLPMDDAPLSAAEGSPLAQPIDIGGFTVGNRFAIHPMEGWDATDDGRPTDNLRRRWRHFGRSGAKLIWGGEAFAVRRDGRANPHQLYYTPGCEDDMRSLLNELLDAHTESFGPGATDDLLVGLQLTHSGRFCRPNRKDTLEPRVAYHHPLLDAKFNIAPDDDSVLWSDDEVRELIDAYITSAKMACDVGFKFVDIKHCHGYLGHEFLSAYDRPGPYGGDFAGRTRFLREICEGVRAACPDLLIGVRLSVFDRPPYKPDPEQTGDGKLGPGIPEEYDGKAYPGFGLNRDNPLELDLTEPIKLLELMRDELGVAVVNLSAGSPYYNPHIQRPAYFPPSDGYQPPEDPLVGCVRQINVVRDIKCAVPGLPIVGTAYTYFQEYVPHLAQAIVRKDWCDIIGLGRLVLSYWDLPADVLAGNELQVKKICRTFSDCTTAPRNGIVSGCYPLDDHYKKSPEMGELKDAKAELRKRLTVLNA